MPQFAVQQRHAQQFGGFGGALHLPAKGAAFLLLGGPRLPQQRVVKAVPGRGFAPFRRKFDV